MIFNSQLKIIRNNKGLTQKQMAELLGIGETHYQKYEQGERKPGLDVLITIADALDVSIDYLAGRTDKPDSHKM